MWVLKLIYIDFFAKDLKKITPYTVNTSKGTDNSLTHSPFRTSDSKSNKRNFKFHSV